ncbi:MAG: TetR/AcrR family transcriptional regulator [Gammaproteobacteria bacterium]|nr:TetR/AcrR family transcriptional regulator [Gammaproteobacteria bacterium]
MSATENTPTRGQRRKLETRRRLLEAAMDLMSQKGMEGVAINEITEAADVGFGTFYNHFESKEAIFNALMDEVFETFGDTIDELVADVEDPAKVLAFSVRYTLLRAQKEPKWGRFLLQEGLSAQSLVRGLGRRMFRDITEGAEAGRLLAPDLYMSVISTGGIVLASIAAAIVESNPDGAEAQLVNSLGFQSGGIAERSACAILKNLGIAEEEALEIANAPFPANPNPV